MSEEQLVYETTMALRGKKYQISVYCRECGRHVAKTTLTEDDIIINDGTSLEEVLAKHQKILPLAVTLRRIFNHY